MLRAIAQHRLADRLHADEEHVGAETGVQFAGLLVVRFLTHTVEIRGLNQTSLGPLQSLVAPLRDDAVLEGGVERTFVTGFVEDQCAAVLLHVTRLLGAGLEERSSKRDAAERGLKIR